MTYAFAWPLQQALYDTIRLDPVCQTFFDQRVHDAAPYLESDAEAEGLYVTIGDDEARDWSSGCDIGSRHLVRLDIHAFRRSFAEAKQAAAAVSDAVLGAELVLTRGRVVNTRFASARTARDENDALRRIELSFQITIEDTL